MRRSPSAFLIVALCAALVLGPLAQPAAAVESQAVREFTISGTGWGHGIGMSQYGAQGYALKGYGYGSILGHYYKGTVVGSATTKDVRVNLDPDARYNSASVNYNGGYTRNVWQVRPGGSSSGLKIAGVAHAYGTYKFTGSGAKVVVTGGDIPTSLTYTNEVGVAATAGDVLQIVEPTGIYALSDCKYRGGVTLYATNSRLKLLNILNIEKYLKGVVPRESPSTWRAEALKAQAVAARSYAYIGTGELYCTTSSQAYQGMGAYNSKGVWVGEVASTNSAVDVTAGRVVKYGGKIVQTFFFSQSGGRTANIEDVWAATPQPYYTSVDDPYENLAGATKCPWPTSDEKHLDGTEMATKLRAAGVSGVPAAPAYVTSVSTERTASGYPRYTTFRFSNTATVRVVGADRVRSAFGLLSPMFYFSGFPISRVYGSNRYATAAAVSRSAFPTTTTVAVVASGEDFADALTGSGVAGAASGSLLLSYKSVLAGETSRELQRLKPTKVYMMGGTGALSSAVENSIRTALPGVTTERIAGADRYATAAKAAGVVATIAKPGKALLVSGTSWPDAAAASALAYANKYPILLTRQASLDPVSAGALRSLKPAETIVAGGVAVVSSAAETAAAQASGGTTRRLAGADRYATSATIARYLFAVGAPEGAWTRGEVFLATGGAFPDALTGGVLAGKKREPMLLTMPGGVANATKFWLRDNRAYISRLVIFGGTAAISNSGFAALDAAMMN